MLRVDSNIYAVCSTVLWCVLTVDPETQTQTQLNKFEVWLLFGLSLFRARNKFGLVVTKKSKEKKKHKWELNQSRFSQIFN
jgi:hypothetical protein